MDNENKDTVTEVEKPEPVTPVAPAPVRTPTSARSNARKRSLTPTQRALREKEQAEKRLKLEEEKQERLNRKEQERLQREEKRIKLEEEKKKRAEEKKAKDEERAKKAEEDRIKKEEEKTKREEERAKKEEEKAKKEEERIKKDEEKRKDKERKEEEKRLKDEERALKKKRREEEEEREKLEAEKKLKALQPITKFFVQKGTPPPTTAIRPSRRSLASSVEGTENEPIVIESESPLKDEEVLPFDPMPFEVKNEMALAPIVRRQMTDEDKLKLDQEIENGSSSFLQMIKSGGRRGKKTDVVYSSDDPDVDVIKQKDLLQMPQGQGVTKWRMKLIQFHENRRPAYWGTWKRPAEEVKARKPLFKHKELDYEIDSDDEWEEEPEDGEDLGDDEKDEEDKEELDEDEEDDGWMVPHGYLSDDEVGEEVRMDKDELKASEKEFYENRKKKLKFGYPKIIVNLGEFQFGPSLLFPGAFEENVTPPQSPIPITNES